MLVPPAHIVGDLVANDRRWRVHVVSSGFDGIVFAWESASTGTIEAPDGSTHGRFYRPDLSGASWLPFLDVGAAMDEHVSQEGQRGLEKIAATGARFTYHEVALDAELRHCEAAGLARSLGQGRVIEDDHLDGSDAGCPFEEVGEAEPHLERAGRTNTSAAASRSCDSRSSTCPL